MIQKLLFVKFCFFSIIILFIDKRVKMERIIKPLMDQNDRVKIFFRFIFILNLKEIGVYCLESYSLILQINFDYSVIFVLKLHWFQ